MQIPFHKMFITEDEVNAAADVIRSGWLTMGQRTIDFENMFQSQIGCSNAAALNSGTAALHLALHLIELQKDDEVIIPANTFTATAEVITYFDAKPVLVDIEKSTHNLDVNKIESKITSKTRAIIPVHFSGQPCDMDEIMEIAKKYDLKVIEDAAHALPSDYKNKKVGTISDLTSFSFYVTKTVAAGEGGMLTMANEECAERAKTLRLHGISKNAWNRYSNDGKWQYDVTEAGYKYNPTDISSAIAIEQFKKLNMLNSKRSAIAEKYNNAFKNNDAFILYEVKPDRSTSWHLYPLKLNIDSLKITRNEFINELENKDIKTSVHFIPLYAFSYYKKYKYDINEFENTAWVFDRTISLPIYPSMTDDEINYVIENIIEITEKFRR